MYEERERNEKGMRERRGYGGGETDSQTQRCKTSILIKAVGISQLFKIVFGAIFYFILKIELIKKRTKQRV